MLHAMQPAFQRPLLNINPRVKHMQSPLISVCMLCRAAKQTYTKRFCNHTQPEHVEMQENTDFLQRTQTAIKS